MYQIDSHPPTYLPINPYAELSEISWILLPNLLLHIVKLLFFFKTVVCGHTLTFQADCYETVMRLNKVINKLIIFFLFSLINSQAAHPILVFALYFTFGRYFWLLIDNLVCNKQTLLMSFILSMFIFSNTKLHT